MKLFYIIVFLSINQAYAQNSVDQINYQLPGKWNWFKTEIVQRGGGGIINPSSCNCNEYLIFKSNNLIDQFKDGVLFKSSSYQLDSTKYNNNPTIVVFHSDIVTGSIFIDKDTLGIGNFGGCGREHYYVRER